MKIAPYTASPITPEPINDFDAVFGGIVLAQRTLATLQAYNGVPYDAFDLGEGWTGRIDSSGPSPKLVFRHHDRDYDSLHLGTADIPDLGLNQEGAQELKRMLFKQMQRQTATYLDVTTKVFLQHKPEQQIIERLQGLAIKHGLSGKQLPVRLIMAEEAEQDLFPSTVKGPHLVLDLNAFGQESPNERRSAFLQELEQYGIVDNAPRDPQDTTASKPRSYTSGWNLLAPPGSKEYELKGHFLVTTTPLNLLFDRLSSTFQKLPPETLKAATLYGPSFLDSNSGDNGHKPITYYLETADGKRYIAESTGQNNCIYAQEKGFEATVSDLSEEYWQEVFYGNERWNELKGKQNPVRPVSVEEEQTRVQQTIQQAEEARQSVIDSFDKLAPLHDLAVRNNNPAAGRMAVMLADNGARSTEFQLQPNITITTYSQEKISYESVIEHFTPASGDTPSQRTISLVSAPNAEGERKLLHLDAIANPDAQLKIYQLVSRQMDHHRSTLLNEQRENLPIGGSIAMGAGALLTAFGLTRDSWLGKIVGSLAGLATVVAGALTTAQLGGEIRESRGQHIAEADRTLSTLARDFLIGLTHGRYGLEPAK